MSPDGSLWPRVSIVTPSFNQGQFIEETIRSVLLQMYPNLEYTVIDGGSTDESVDVIRRYSEWLADWVSEADRGQSHAINKGWSKASGDIIAWLNSDDIYLPGAVAQAARALKRNPQAAGVYSNCVYVDMEGRSFTERRPGEIDFDRLLRGLVSYVPQPTLFLRREVVEQIGLLDETLQYSMDYDLCLRVCMEHRLEYVDETWAAARFHDAAKTVACQRQNWEDKVSVFDKTFSSPRLPARFIAQRSAIYSAYHSKTASVFLQEGSLIGALRHLGRAIMFRPTVILSFRDWRRLSRALWKLIYGAPRKLYWPAG